MEHKYIVTNRKTREVDYEFEGTEYQFALTFANLDRHIDIGYPDEIIKSYRHAILQDEIDEDRIPKYEAAIADLEKMDKDSVAAVAEVGGESFTVTDVYNMDDDFFVKRHDLVQEIEVGVNFFIDAVKENNIANDSQWIDWNNAEQIIDVYTQDERSSYIFVGGRANVTKELEAKLKEESRTDHILNGYISGSVPRKELLTMAKSLSDNQIIALEDKLEAKGIDLKKFQNDLKKSALKFKP